MYGNQINQYRSKQCQSYCQSIKTTGQHSYFSNKWITILFQSTLPYFLNTLDVFKSIMVLDAFMKTVKAMGWLSIAQSYITCFAFIISIYIPSWLCLHTIVVTHGTALSGACNETMGHVNWWITPRFGEHWRERGLSEIWKDRSKDWFRFTVYPQFLNPQDLISQLPNLTILQKTTLNGTPTTQQKEQITHFQKLWKVPSKRTGFRDVNKIQHRNLQNTDNQYVQCLLLLFLENIYPSFSSMLHTCTRNWDIFL